MSNMTRESVSSGLCSNIMRTDKLDHQKEMKQSTSVSLSEFPLMFRINWTNKKLYQLWRTSCSVAQFSASEHCSFRSPVASPSDGFWLLQDLLRVLDRVDQLPRVPFDAQLRRFRTRHRGLSAVKWYSISVKGPEV